MHRNVFWLVAIKINKAHVDSKFQDMSHQLNELLFVSPITVVFGVCRPISMSRICVVKLNYNLKKSLGASISKGVLSEKLPV